MNRQKKVFALLLVLCMVFTALPVLGQEAHAAAFYGYDANAAVAYAAAHWNDGGPYCDWFVKDVLRAGNIATNIENSEVLVGEHAHEFLPSDVTPLRQGLLDLNYGSSHDLVLGNGYASAANNPNALAGDVLFWYCDGCGDYLHTGILGGPNANGNLFFYAHNPGAGQESHFGSYTCPKGHSGSDIHISYIRMSNNPGHEHVFRVRQMETAHPHRMFASCTVAGCTAKFYHGFNARFSNCPECTGSTDEVPVVTAVFDATSNKIRLSWNAVAGATSYTVSRATAANGTYFDLGTVSGTSFVNTLNENQLGKTFYYKVTTDNGKVSEVVSVVASDVPTLDAPGIQGSTNANGKPVLTWGAIAGAEKYELYRATSASGSYSLLITTTGTTVTNSSAAAGMTYYYKVRAIADGSNPSAYSNVISVTAGAAKPTLAAPSLSGSVNASGKPVLTWGAIAGAEKYELYRATSASGSYSRLIITTGTTVTNSSAAAGMTYYYKVRAIADGANPSAYSNVVSVTAKTAKPTLATPSLSGSVNASGKPVLTWGAIAGAEKYELYRATSAGGSYSLLITTAGTKVTHSSAAAGSTTYYKVRAIADGANASAYSNVVMLVASASAPVLNAPVLQGSVNTSSKPVLTWDAVSGAQKYELYRAASAAGPFSLLITTTGTKVTHSSAAAGSTTYYKVRAVSGSVSSPDSNTVMVIAAPATSRLEAPGVKITLNTSGKPVLTWDAVFGAEKYEVYRATSENGSYSLLITTAGTKLTNSSAVSGTTYFYKVRAIAEGKDPSAYSQIVSITAGAALSAPSAQGSLNNNGKPVITWDAVTGAAKYEVYRATSANGTYTRLITVTGTRCIHTGATAGNTYFYKVRALTDSGAPSAYSNVVSLTAR